MEPIFPLTRLDDIRDRPENFRLLERIPLTLMADQMPIDIDTPVGDELSVVIIDLETTGFDVLADEVIEVGLVRVRVSPSQNRVTRVERVGSYYRDPGMPIPEVITGITGIDDTMVVGKILDLEELATWFADDPLAVAHNAKFDRPFFEKSVPGFDRLRWACTANGIPWSELGFESRKLEYLLLRLGYFYEGHRASIDCLATAWLLIAYPESVKPLLEGAARLEYFIRARGAPFEVKDHLKSRGYRWNAPRKVWETSVIDEVLPEEKAWLAALYPRGDERSEIQALDARSRFLKD